MDANSNVGAREMEDVSVAGNVLRYTPPATAVTTHES